MKRIAPQQRERLPRSGGRVAAGRETIAPGKRPAGKSRDGVPPAIFAEMEQQRDLLEIQNAELARAHSALEISHQRFAELHEQAPVGYLTFDAQGCIRDINTEAERILCTRRATAIGKPFVVYVEQPERRKFLEHLWKMRRTTSAIATDLRLAVPDGTLRNVRMSTRPHRDADGRSRLFLTAIEDVTELRAASASAAYLASIVESSQDAIARFSSEGIVQSWNPGAESLFGYSASEMIGRHVSLLAPADRREEVDRILQIGAAGERVPPFETVRRRKDGSRVDVEVTRSPIVAGGSVVAIAAIWRDISERKRAEEKIREGEARLRAVLENSLDAAYRRNLQTDGYDYVSPVIEQISGYTAEELGAKSLGDLFKWIHPADVREVQRTFKKAMATGRPCRLLEYRFRCKDGSYRWIAETFRVLRDESGQPLHLVGTVRDASERKEMEAALLESQRLARSTVEAIPAQIAVIEASGTIVEVNKAWRSFALANGGTRETTGRGANYLEMCGRVHGMERRDAKRFASGVRFVLRGKRRIFSMEYPCHSPAGKRWFAVYVTPFAGEGERRAVVAHVDVTAVKLAEEKFRDVLESAPDAMVIVDREGEIQMVNRQTEKIFGYRRRELLGRKLEMLMPAGPRSDQPDDRARRAANADNRAMGERRELAARRKDGSEFPAEISLSPLRTEHGLLVCGAIRDITGRKKADEAIRMLNAELEQRVAARTEALTEALESLKEAVTERRRLEQEVLDISETERQRIGQDLHDDLGQRLAGLWFFSSALEKNLRAASSPEADNAARIAGQLDKALGLTRSLARGLQPVMPEPGGLMAALRELAARSTELFKVRCRFACGRPVHVHDPGVATHLYRIAQEAVTNAARHARARHIFILLSSSASELVLSVNDDGRGMQGMPGRDAGMGIRTMNYRAEALGGSLVFRSKRRGGTSVVCTIPPPPEEALT